MVPDFVIPTPRELTQTTADMIVLSFKTLCKIVEGP